MARVSAARGAVAALVLVLVLVAAGVQARGDGLEDGYRACRTLAEANDRLACFDRLMPTPTGPAVDAPPAAAPAADSSGVRAFGAETLRRPADDPERLDSIESRILGPVGQIRRGDRYTLENGQVWQNIDDRDVDVDFNGPAVTIERNFIGSYWMRFHDGHLRIRVRRLR